MSCTPPPDGRRKEGAGMKAIVVVDNIEADGIKGEWGLCIYIEYNGKKILLDTGASGLFAKNAKKLGLSLDDISYAVLSHAHYDHSDGMREFFKINRKAEFYLREDCQENCYAKKWMFSRYIGIEKGILEENKERIKYVSGDFTIMDGVSLIPHKTKGLSQIGRREGMYRKEKGKWVLDDFSHEQSLVFDTPKGLIIFNSCSHGGAGNIIREVMRSFPGKRALALIGGFHLYNKPEIFVRELAGEIKRTGIDTIYTGHCTGEKAFRILKEELGERAVRLKTGLVMEF